LSLHTRNKQTEFEAHSKDVSDTGKNSVLKVPQPTTAKTTKRRVESNSTWKRTYTEEELQAALEDIQSGKLGTRRAAVIYGIPRSTLRNKVYKLSHDRPNSKKPFKLQKETGVSPAANHSLEQLAQNNSASESLKQILKHAITQRANNNYNVQGVNSSSSKPQPISDPSAQLCNLFADPFATFHMLSAVDPSNSGLTPLFSQFLANIQQLALARSDIDLSNYSTESLMAGNLALLPDLIRKLTRERVEKERIETKTIKEDVGNSSNVILKVPSYKPKHSFENSSKDKKERSLAENKTSENCTVSSQCSGDVEFENEEEKVKDNLNSKLFNNNEYSEESSCSDALISESKSLDKSDKRTSSLNTSDQSNPSTPDMKRNRPKRGRYRNYNRDDLAKAVRAVQKGEMSVHRAGTLYGVPHSTLEYKVKERHLLRPKKRQQNSSHSSAKKVDNKQIPAKSPSPVSSKANSQASSSPPPPKAAVTSLPLWQAALPLFSTDLGSSQNNNFFASNMMRKLQENARLNEEMQQQSNSSEFSSLLLENLIKSSLDKKNVNSEKEKDNCESDQQEEKSKFNASLAALKEVSALDKKE
ncbi:mushroom body large-type Kenyon cell-specific protein 1-like protein, partial [Dinothrombium tinctorium]